MASSFEVNFCGSEFWNINETWTTEDPDFTKCFHKTVLAWAPSAFFFFFAMFELKKITSNPNGKISWNIYNLTKVILTLSLISVSIAEIALIAREASDDSGVEIYPVDYLAPCVYLLTFLGSMALLVVSIRYGSRTSSSQFYLYLVWVFCGGVTLRSIVRTETTEDPNVLLITYTIMYVMVCAMFILNLFADSAPSTSKDELKDCPRLSASYFSKLIYMWSVKLLWKGWRKPLEPSDLWDLDPKLTSKSIVPQFDSNMETANLETPQKKISIFPGLLKTFGVPFFVGSFLKIVYDVLTVFNPQVMKLMINYVETYARANQSDPTSQFQPEESWKGYFYAVLLLIATVFQSLLLSQYFERMFVVGMNLRTALISTIYRKSLRMSSSAKKDSTIGEIVNLMSVDAQRFMDLTPYLNMLWSSPLQIALCCYFIYEELGAAIFSGVAVLILTIPINTVVARMSRKYQLDQMKNKDKRTKLMNEIIGGVKVLKLYGWEPSFINQVLGIRDNEIVVLKKSAWLMSMVAFIWTSVPFLVALASFATYVFMDEGNTLDATRTFVTMSYLNIMRMPMAIFPFLVVGLVQARVSIERVNKFINNDELDPTAVEHDTAEVDPIVVEKGTFKWGENDPEILRDINIKVKKGSLTAVVGTVGSGKSSLISALLGEMVKSSGRVNVLGSVAFVPQQAWMQNATLKNNVLFGKSLNNDMYERVIDACALRSDIDILPGGDQTEIGEKGINLSGGQKQRVALARAVYSEAETYLLDDPLSAVDSHVGKHIFEKVLGPNGVLTSKTRLLVTHGITYLPLCDHIIVLKNGRVSEQGSYKELLERKGDFADFLCEFMSDADKTDLDEETIHQLEETLGKETIARQLSPQKSVDLTRSTSVDEGGKKLMQSTSVKETTPNTDLKKGTTLIEKESVETGSVKLDVYWYYMKNVGIVGSTLCIAMQLLYQGSSVVTNFWLNFWSDNKFGNSAEPKYRDLYLGVYGALGFVQSIAVMILTISLSLTTLDASKRMHKTLLDRVMRSPMSFFDTTPLGRIVNRFAKDIDVCDNTLPTNIRQWLSTFSNFIATIILIVAVVPIFGAVIVPVAIAFFAVQSVYVSTSRQLKRLESVSRSPIYSHFGETLSGTSTIRAFNLEKQFILQSEQQVDANHICYYPSIIANRWLAIWLEMIGNLITVAAALFAIISPESINPSEVGLIITYALNVTQVLNWLVRMTSDVETNIVAVERVKEYAEIEQEAVWSSASSKPAKEWPQSGAIEFKNYGMRYREGLDLVLKGISCKISGGEMIGIVGRTGAGKSSLTGALFRLVEPAEGQIVIDDIDVGKIGLHDLRTKLTIIPQDPVLFSGSLRINLDPFNISPDEEIWSALKLAHLHEFVSGLEAGLEHEVSEGGSNLSVGQRQLICLARALLRKTKVLILDEATAAVDLETDDLIQATIRKEFKGCTVLTIAHRLNTIMDYDRIMVMDKGHIAEFDTPKTLLENKGTIFYSMVKDAGLVN